MSSFRSSSSESESEFRSSGSNFPFIFVQIHQQVQSWPIQRAGAGSLLHARPSCQRKWTRHFLPTREEMRRHGYYRLERSSVQGESLKQQKTQKGSWSSIRSRKELTSFTFLRYSTKSTLQLLSESCSTTT